MAKMFPHYFLLTVDVEDWFQVENFKGIIAYDSWDRRELRVERNTHRLLDLFDSLKGSKVQGFKGSRETKRKSQVIQNSGGRSGEARSGVTSKSGRGEERKSGKIPNVEHRIKKANRQNQQPTTNKPQTVLSQPTTHNPQPTAHLKVRATFFILGWIAERLPRLVREIRDRGHEVASHGYGHELCGSLSPVELKEDLVGSRHLLEDIMGGPILGYRAPSFSVDNATLKIIEDAGYRYDSSYNAFGLHGRYGKILTNGFRREGIAYRISDRFHEIPISNLNLKPMAYSLWPLVLPFSGGGYFRLIPSSIFNRGVGSILKKEGGYVFYMHPWEVDPDQPRVSDAPRTFRFRHYVNLHKTEGKLENMIRRFAECRFSTCAAYVEGVEKGIKKG